MAKLKRVVILGEAIAILRSPDVAAAVELVVSVLRSQRVT